MTDALLHQSPADIASRVGANLVGGYGGSMMGRHLSEPWTHPYLPTARMEGLLGAPKVKAVRGYSDFGYSYVYVVFQDGTDVYWARSRTLEYLSSVLPRLPQGVKTELGPDATGLGWVFQYVLVDASGVDEDDSAYDDLIARGFRSVPVTVIGDQVVRGFDADALTAAVAAWRAQS